jgi:hypothetical protein
MKTPHLVLFSCLCLAFVPALPASVLVSTSSSLPSNIAFSNTATTTDRTIAWYNTVSSVEREVAQSFQAETSFELTSITMLLNDSGGAIGNASGTGQTNTQGAAFSLSVYSSATNRFDTSGTTQLLSSQSGNLPTTGFTSTNVQGDYITFTLDVPITITAGTYYAFAFSFDTQATDRALQFVVNDNTLPSTGYAYAFTNAASSPSSWVANGSNDYAFYLAAVPEPSGLALSGAGVLGLLMRRKMRR